MTFDLARLERRIAALEANRGASLRFGTVTEVNAEAGSARVQLHDAVASGSEQIAQASANGTCLGLHGREPERVKGGGNMVSMPLRVLQERTHKDQLQVLPDLGEPVAALFSGQGLEQGVILGAHYSTKTPPPGQPAKIDYTRYEDGTEVFYDREAHKLTAKVKGDAEIETTGSIALTSAKDISLTAPRISLAGMLRVTDKNGQAGSGELLGTFMVRQGDLFVPDGDVAASSVSLVDHLHDGVEKGPDVTGTPIGDSVSGGDPNHNGVYESYFNAVYDTPPTGATDKDKLLLCLPEIAAAEASRAANPADAQGWSYLQGMFYRWFTGPANETAKANPIPYWVNWNWVMQFERARIDYALFTSPPVLDAANIYTENACQSLGRILERNGYLAGETRSFDFTTSHWPEWEDKYHTLRPIPEGATADGLQAALAGCTLRALAKGVVEPNDKGGHTIHVTHVSVFVHDQFNFAGFEYLGGWNCEDKQFSSRPPYNVGNHHFNEFRNRHGLGSDFLVLSMPHPVEHFEGISYDYTCQTNAC